MTDTPPEPALPPSLRLLKGLVTVLMATMIVGVITVVGLLVTRMPNGNAIPPTMPASLQMPEGVKARAITMGTGWIAVVSADDQILIFTPEGQLHQTIAITPISAP